MSFYWGLNCYALVDCSLAAGEIIGSIAMVHGAFFHTELTRLQIYLGHGFVTII